MNEREIKHLQLGFHLRYKLLVLQSVLWYRRQKKVLLRNCYDHTDAVKL